MIFQKLATTLNGVIKNTLTIHNTRGAGMGALKRLLSEQDKPIDLIDKANELLAEMEELKKENEKRIAELDYYLSQMGITV